MSPKKTSEIMFLRIAEIYFLGNETDQRARPRRPRDGKAPTGPRWLEGLPKVQLNSYAYFPKASAFDEDYLEFRRLSMSLFVPDASRRELLKWLLGIVSETSYTYGIYTNNHTPVAGDTLSNYTESTDPSYVAAAITQSSWSVATAGGVTTATYPQVTYTFANAGSFYGYIVYDSTPNLLWVEVFAGGPIVFATGGGQILLTPTCTFANA
jgi:hypothetical protein